MGIHQTNMRQLSLFILAVFLSLVSTPASAYDFSQENNDGVTIYYNYINNGTELEVTGKSYPNASYTGTIAIPETVTYMNRTRNVTSIGKNAFYNCFGLTSVIIPNSVTSIEKMAFYCCNGLSSVIIGNKLTSIGQLAFGYCSNLSSVFLPNSTTTIGEGAFYWCTSFSSINIPQHVTSIGWSAFDGCNMATVISEIIEPFAINIGTFSNNTFYNATLYVPVGTIDKYKACEGWKKFLYIVEGTPSGIETAKSSVVTTAKERYTLDGKYVSEPQRGLNIVRLSDGTIRKVVMK